MKHVEKYELTVEEHSDVMNKLGLLKNAIDKEKKALYDIPDNEKTHAENIASNTADYCSSLLYDLERLLS